MEIEDIAHRNLPGRSLGTHSQLPPDGASTALGVCADHASVSPADPRALARNSRSPSKVTSSAYAVEPVPRPDPRTGRTLYALRADHSLRASPEEACVLVDLDHCCGGHSGVPDPQAVAGRRILVFDDVLTDGFTIREVARRLREAGAAEVSEVVLAPQPFGG